MPARPTAIDALTHSEATRLNAPTAELAPVIDPAFVPPMEAAFARRNRDLDPQLVWRGKDTADWSDLVVNAPPLYVQEKIHPRAIVEGLRRYKGPSDALRAPPPQRVGEETPPSASPPPPHQDGEERATPPQLVGEVAARRADGGASVTPQPSLFPDLFADFNGLPDPQDRYEAYAHDQHWSNRMILGDALQVMASLAEREGMKGRVQCIYIDPPYGIKFNSNFQWSTTSRDVKDGKADHLTREPEQVKAFRDTWADGIHSYLTYLRDRLTVARDLLTESGSVFVQIGDENVHRVRALMDEVFGDENFVSEILVKKKGSQKSSALDPVNDYILWYSKEPRSSGKLKIRSLFEDRFIDGETVDEFSRLEMPDGRVINLKQVRDEEGDVVDYRAFPRRIERDFPGGRLLRPWPISNGGERAQQMDPVLISGRAIQPPRGRCWSHTSKPQASGLSGMERNLVAGRLMASSTSLDFKRYLDDFPYKSISNWWDGFGGASNQVYVVQTNERVLQRLILMTTDPGDLVLDPTCGSGTTAYVAEQWGRRWITIDTSRVALALARARIMGARYPWYLLADSPEGQRKEAEVTRSAPKHTPTHGRLRQGFVYRRQGYITSGRIANNAEIDTIWAGYEGRLEPLREALNAALGRGVSGPTPPSASPPPPQRVGEELGSAIPPQRVGEETPPSAAPTPPHQDGEVAARSADGGASPEAPLHEWQLPRTAPADWPDAARALLPQYWTLRIARQREIDASIAANAKPEYLYDQPYEWKDRDRLSKAQDGGDRWRVAGPFTVESLSPHRVPAMDVDDSLFDELEAAEGRRKKGPSVGSADTSPTSWGGAGRTPPHLDREVARSAGGVLVGKAPRSAGAASERPDFAQLILDNLRRSGVQQRDRADRLVFDSLKGWPGDFVCAEGRVRQASDADDVAPRRAAITVGPEYGTVARADLTAAAREAAEAGFDLLIVAAFNFDAHASEFEKMGRLTVLKARINPDLHMPDLANTGSGNLFTVFGEPDIQVHDEGGGCVSIEVAGIDMYKGGQIEASSADDIAIWFIDTDYDYESFFVRHAYFPSAASDPYKSLRTTLKAEIDEEAWASLKRTRSRPFPRPANGRVAVKVINHLGDEVMKVVGV